MAVSDKNVGVALEPSRGSWSSTDSILYALGVGAGIQDPVGFELEFTTENSMDVEQKALPTMPVVIDTGGVADATGLIGDFDFTKLLHGGQAVTLHRELPAEGEVEATTTLAEVWDKGKSAIVVLESTANLTDDGRPLFTTRTTLVLRGEGGFGGERGPSGGESPIPDRDPDHEVAYDIRPDQPLLYRLSGDRNPLHSDPKLAEMAGFDRPILHGLCTFGHAGRALLHTLCDSDPAAFGHIEGKFTSPVMPGETLTTRMWVDGDGAAFDVTGSDGRVVFGDGLFREGLVSDAETEPRALVEDRGNGVRLITMNRPDALNAFDADQYEQTTAALTDAAANDDVVVVVITGAGRAFSSGADTQVLAGDTDDPERISKAFPQFCERLVDFPKPLIAAVNGVGVGIGMTMLLHCDMVLMADDARLRTPFAKIHVSPEAGSSALLPAAIGPQQAARMLMVGDWVEADEAVRLGLALDTVPGDRLLQEALDLAARVAEGDPHSLRATKHLLVEGRAKLLGDTIHHEIEVLTELVVRRMAEKAG